MTGKSYKSAIEAGVPAVRTDTQDHPPTLEIARDLDVGVVFFDPYFRGGLFGMPSAA